MNASELSFAISLIAGLMYGGGVGRPFGTIGVILGGLGGLLVGLTCYFIVIGLSVGLAKVAHSLDDPPKNRLLFIPWWIANFTAVMILILAPIGTIEILSWIGALLKK